MTDLKSLNLTERDFNLLVDGLDALPEKGAAGEMMGDLMVGLLSKDIEQQDKLKLDIEKRRRDKDYQKNLLREDIRILQGKLIMLKRYLMENKLLNDTYDIIKHF